MSDKKHCKDCGHDKPLGEFYKNRAMRDGLSFYCKPCHQVRSTARLRGPDRDRYLRMRRDGNLRRKHGISADDYDSLVDLQGGKCWICRRPPSDVKGLVIDHDHRCCPRDRSCERCRRALLCGACNKAIGLLRDDPVRMQAAIDYVTRANMHDPVLGGRY